MKKKSIGIIVGLTALSMVLAGCGGSASEGTQTPPQEVVDFSSLTENTQQEETPVKEEEPAQEETVEEVIPEGMYRSELTNEWIDEALQNQRPIAVMVDNEKTALPHYGLTEADVVYEMMNSTANQRITRFMAIVKDWGKIEQLGSIRSTRPTNVILAMEWNAILCHDGGPFYIDSWIAHKESANLNGGFSRVNNGKAREFTEYILSGDLESKIKNKGYSTEYNEYYKGSHFVFADTEVDLAETHADAKNATEVKLPFPHNSSTLKYNEKTGTYDYYEYGEAHVDPQHDNAILSFENVILQGCDFSQLDDHGYLIYNCLGSGENGYYLTGGKAIPVTWMNNGQVTSPTVFIDKATGKQIEMNTGKTYIAIVPGDTWDEVVIK